MDKNIIENNFVSQNVIDLLKAYNGLTKNGKSIVFDDYIKTYGKKKAISILNARGFRMYGIVPNISGKILENISAKMLNRATSSKFESSQLYSSFAFVKYDGDGLNFFEEQSNQLVFNCLIQKKFVDIKKLFSLEQLKNEIESGRVVLLDVKEKPVDVANYFTSNLKLVDREYIKNFGDNYIQKRIFPTIKYVGGEFYEGNKNFYFNKFNNLQNEYLAVEKGILRTLLEYELQNDQVEISYQMEKAQNKIMKLAGEYQKSATQMGKMLSLNQMMLEKLGGETTISQKQSKEKDFEF